MRLFCVTAVMILLAGLSCKKKQSVSVPVAPPTAKTVTVYIGGHVKKNGVYSETSAKPIKLLNLIHKAGGGDGESADYEVVVGRNVDKNLRQTTSYSSLAAMESTWTDMDLQDQDEIFIKAVVAKKN